MTGFIEKYGSQALIAGASEGLGAAWSKALAARGMDLLLIARRKNELEILAADLSRQFNIKTQVLNCDLAGPEANRLIMEFIGDKKIDFLVCNAAASEIGPFISTALSKHREIISLNINAALSLVHELSVPMLARKKGGIVLMSSLAGFQGSGYLATYAATKAFIRVFAESLWYEWKGKGVDIIACCAGATATPNYLATRPGKTGFLAPKPQLPEKVVEECLLRLGHGPSFVSGMGNRLAAFIMQKLLPRKLAIRIMGDTTRKMYSIMD